MDLHDLQAEHKLWVERNFPNELPHSPLLGLAEEVGELAHAHLKFEQNIRGYDVDRYRKEAEDAIGDIIIYLSSYCNRNGFSLSECADKAWNVVRQRDWVANPENGVKGVPTS